jgi:hypothetical protein
MNLQLLRWLVSQTFWKQQDNKVTQFSCGNYFTTWLLTNWSSSRLRDSPCWGSVGVCPNLHRTICARLLGPPPAPPGGAGWNYRAPGPRRDTPAGIVGPSGSRPFQPCHNAQVIDAQNRSDPKIILFCSVVDPDPGSGAFFDPWIRDG